MLPPLVDLNWQGSQGLVGQLKVLKKNFLQDH